jgi:hypothetical protein
MPNVSVGAPWVGLAGHRDQGGGDGGQVGLDVGSGGWAVGELVHAGLLTVGDGCRIHPTAVFLPADRLGTLRPITLADRVTVGAFAVLHGGARIGP